MKRLLLALLLTGCASKPVQTPVYHPPLPAPIEVPNIALKVVRVDNKPMVAVSWEDSQKLGVFLGDVKRYLKETRVVMCNYRKDLKEERCNAK